MTRRRKERVPDARDVRRTPAKRASGRQKQRLGRPLPQDQSRVSSEVEVRIDEELKKTARRPPWAREGR